VRWNQAGEKQIQNIILINSHGGSRDSAALAQDVSQETGARILVVNWWSYCSDLTVDL
jgi:creatinine amidohydrolase